MRAAVRLASSGGLVKASGDCFALLFVVVFLRSERCLVSTPAQPLSHLWPHRSCASRSDSAGLSMGEVHRPVDLRGLQ